MRVLIFAIALSAFGLAGCRTDREVASGIVYRWDEQPVQEDPDFRKFLADNNIAAALSERDEYARRPEWRALEAAIAAQDWPEAKRLIQVIRERVNGVAAAPAHDDAATIAAAAAATSAGARP